MKLPVIDTVKIFQFNIRPDPTALGSSWQTRQQIFLKLGAAGVEGWGECPIALDKPNINVMAATHCFEILRGKTFGEAFAYIRSRIGVWPFPYTEAAEMALIDLNGKVTGRSAADILALNGRLPVHGVTVLRQKSPADLQRAAKCACQSRKANCIRILLTGHPDRDQSTVAAIREVAPRKKVFLIGDACERYSSSYFRTIEQIGIQLLKLYAAGLDACEDPASIPTNSWITLQAFASPLELSADKPLRHACRSVMTVHPKMAHIYNIHPDFMGSITDAVRLAERVHFGGNRVYIGDDLCIGPACDAWQQIAIALGAEWVETLEKPRQAPFYAHAKRQCGVLFCNGVYNQLQNVTGFGTVLDEAVLSEHAAFILDL